MSVTYSIIDTKPPLSRFNIEIIAPINVNQTYVVEYVNEFEPGSDEFNEKFNYATNRVENAYKTLPEFIVQDSSRNIVWNYVSLGGMYYIVTHKFTIKNAEIKLIKEVTTELVEEEKEKMLQSLAETTVAEFKSLHNWVDSID